MSIKYQQGFTSLEEEVEIDQLPVSGQLPSWLVGTLVRHVPAKYEIGAHQYHHWFDGLSMLHRFSFKDGMVSYANKFLQEQRLPTINSGWQDNDDHFCDRSLPHLLSAAL